MANVSLTNAPTVRPSPTQSAALVRAKLVFRIVSDRKNPNSEQEEYLVQWTSDNTEYPPLSWHGVDELQPCLEKLQAYVERTKSQSAFRKRKSPSDEERIPTILPEAEVYNGVKTGIYFTQCIPAADAREEVVKLHIQDIPSPRIWRAGETREADVAIWIEFARRLEGTNKKRGEEEFGKRPPITISNTVDRTSPSLKFRFIEENKLGKGVFRAPAGTVTGCKSCAPAMGRGIGCEYTKKCECLEYAPVHKERLSTPERERYKVEEKKEFPDTTGFPKRFPYYSTNNEKNGCMVTFYLESRSAIFECNPECKCGPRCKTRIVQHGRQVPLEIFKTADRGWGLRSNVDLLKGQFIDCYLGEIITDAEATRRETKGGKGKNSYLYSLDKFAEAEQMEQEDIYVIDGEFYGGATRFINHSCDPNCRQYAVSYNRNDAKIYELAFFAYRNIPAGEELVFDYLDKDDRDTEEKPPGDDAIQCRCGASNCRKYLWF